MDKLDKAPWAEVRKEMTVEKGLDGGIADRIGEYVGIKGESFVWMHRDGYLEMGWLMWIVGWE